MPTFFVFVGSLLAALAVALVAMGAHALKEHLTPDKLDTFHTAVQYQMLHAIGLILVGLLALHGSSRFLDWAGGTMLLGVVLFSGCLFAWLASGFRPLVHVVPVGGTALIVSWLLLALGSFRLTR